jgi:hypothetical protein
MTQQFTPIVATTPATKKKGKGRKFAVAGVLTAAVLTGVLIGKGGSGSTADAAAAPVTAPETVTFTKVVPTTVTKTVLAPPPAPVTVTVEPPKPVVVGPAEEITKSGVYVVGTDIKAGKWKTDGKISAGSYVGYFAILADPTGSTSDVDNIITNDNPEGQAFATLEDGQGLENNNLHWVKVG